MNDHFERIMAIDDVQGVVWLDGAGSMQDSASNIAPRQPYARWPWRELAAVWKDIGDAEFVYEKIRIYIRRINSGYVVVILGRRAQMSMIRLACEQLP